MNSIKLVLVLAYCVSAVGFIKVYIYSVGMVTSAYYNRTFSFSVTFPDENLNIPFYLASHSDVSICTRPQKHKVSITTYLAQNNIYVGQILWMLPCCSGAGRLTST